MGVSVLMMWRQWLGAVLWVSAGCVDRELDDEMASQTDGGPEDLDEPDDSDPPESDGRAPGEAGGDADGARPDDGMYAACELSEDCGDLEFCVSPAEELGFCTDACNSANDPSGCDPSPGGAAELTCLEIGTPDGRRVCALDCADDRSCPEGMRCERVQTTSGGRSICF